MTDSSHLDFPLVYFVYNAAKHVVVNEASAQLLNQILKSRSLWQNRFGTNHLTEEKDWAGMGSHM